MRWKSLLKKITEELSFEVGFETLKKALKGNIERTITTNPRADVMRVLAAMGNSPAAATILNRLRVAEATAEPGYENDLMLALGGVLPSKDGKVDEDAGKTIYEWVGSLSDENFAVFIHGMQHDPYMQRLSMAWRNAKVGEAVDDILTFWQDSAARRGKP